jgi:hypothetical protein
MAWHFRIHILKQLGKGISKEKDFSSGEKLLICSETGIVKKNLRKAISITLKKSFY